MDKTQNTVRRRQAARPGKTSQPAASQRQRNASGNASRGKRKNASGSLSRDQERSTQGNVSRSRRKNASGNSSRNMERNVPENTSRSRQRSVQGNSSRSRQANASEEISRSRRKSTTGNIRRSRQGSVSGTRSHTASSSGKHRAGASSGSASHAKRAGAGLARSGASFFGSVLSRAKVFLNPLVLMPAAVKWTAFVLTGLLLFSQLRVKDTSATTFDTMSRTVMETADLSNTVQGDNQMVRRLYGITPSDYDGVLLFCPKTNMGAEELFLVRLKDPSQAEGVMASIEKRLETQLASFNGYGVDQTEMLEKSVTLSEGGYCLFYSGNDPQKVRNIVKSTL